MPTATSPASFTRDRDDLYESVLEFARAEWGARAEQIDADDQFPPDTWQRLAEQGYLGAAIPEQYGGSGGDYHDAAAICEALARVCPPIALSYGAHLNLCAHNILRNGTDEQRERWLPKLCSGEWIGAMALTEPDRGSDAMGLRTTAVADGADWRISGSKMFITNGPDASLCVVYARTDPAAAPRGLTAFVVELPAEGFTVSRTLDKVGHRGSKTGELAFDATPVPATNVLGEVDQGHRVVMSGLDLERAFLAYMGLGVAEECLDLSLRYAREREQFGQPIAGFQLIQAKLAEMYTGLYAARHACNDALARCQRGERASLQAAAAVMFSSEHAVRAAEEAVQIHGGYGYMREFAVQRLWRDSKLGTIGAGTSEIRRLLIARELLGER
jgi:isovaleryl-CoA dehydrogenase